MSVLMGKLAIRLSRLMGHRGTDVGGRIALKFNRKLFKKLASNIDNIIIVTGTNGKSTVTNILASIFEEVDSLTISNKTGANMYTGILSTMVEAYKFFGNNKIKYAIFEVDEANVPKIMAEIDNNYLVLTNFFRDQLDRYSEIDMIVDKVKASLENKNVNVILNVDDPFCLRFRDYHYVGYGLANSIDIFDKGSISDSKYCPVCGKELVYSHHFYSQLGYYSCSCGFTRPKPKYLLEDIEQYKLTINGTTYHHNVLGSYNACNILAALATIKEFKISDEIIQRGLSKYHSNDGRMQLLKVNNHDVYLNLVKNPAGMNMTIQEMVNIQPSHVCFILNDAVGDGIDVSWIWDTDFEKLLNQKITKFFACGTRAEEMGLRLKNMGLKKDYIIVEQNFVDVVDEIAQENAVICASYTALNDTKNVLLSKEEK